MINFCRKYFVAGALLSIVTVVFACMFGCYESFAEINRKDAEYAKKREVTEVTEVNPLKDHLEHLQRIGCEDLKGKAIGLMSADDLRDVGFCQQLGKW
jgi:hypothetical protein